MTIAYRYIGVKNFIPPGISDFHGHGAAPAPPGRRPRATSPHYRFTALLLYSSRGLFQFPAHRHGDPRAAARVVIEDDLFEPAGVELPVLAQLQGRLGEPVRLPARVQP